MIAWIKKVIANKRINPTIEVNNFTGSRLTQEKIASLNIGQAFGITTREGIKIFKLIKIMPHKEQEVK